ncbi:MAG: AMP-binding protein, partial [Gemmatimonadales bacterium]|nr:AMP-binding protein [Gemmatimonadales bacterium]
MRAKRNGQWVDLSYRELGQQVRDLSIGLLELGVRPGDRVAILSENRPEWAMADYACLAARCTDVPIYPTLPAKQAEYVLRDSGAVAIFVSNRGHLDKVESLRGRLPALAHVITLDPELVGPGVRSLKQVMAGGQRAASRHPDWQSQALRAEPGDLATLIYTSGTTGEPKG